MLAYKHDKADECGKWLVQPANQMHQAGDRHLSQNHGQECADAQDI